MNYFKAVKLISNLHNIKFPEEAQHGSYLNKGHWRRCMKINKNKFGYIN